MGGEDAVVDVRLEDISRVIGLVLPAGPGGLHATLPPWRWIAAGIVAFAAMLPPIRSRLSIALARVRHPSARTRALGALGIALAASLYFVLTAINQDRDFFPKTHDECSYLIQMRMLAAGRLWMPRHELADFFDSFYVLTKPLYASMYFPGTAMLFTPAVWLHLPTWVIPVIVAGAIVGLLYRIITELVDGVAGAIAALLVVSLSWYRMLSIMLMSQLPLVLFGLIMLWAWLRWRSGSRRRRWLLLVGACAGWAAITRPLDALCFAIPVGIAILADLRFAPSPPGTPGGEGRGEGGLPFNIRRSMFGVRRSHLPSNSNVEHRTSNVERRMKCEPPHPNPLPRSTGGEGIRRASGVFGFILLGAAPFLAIQGIFNVGVTGHLLRTPFGLYADRDFPGTAYGFHAADPNARPQSVVRQKQLEYTYWAEPFIRARDPAHWAGDWWRRRLPMIADVTLPARPLLILLPVGLFALTDRRRWALAATLPLFLLGYLGYTFFLEHYALVIMPAIVLLLALAVKRVGEAWPRLLPAVTCAIIALALTNLWELNHSISDEPFRATWLRVLHNTSDSNAIVLFTFDLDATDPDLVQKIAQEPVYNTDVAWPDDAPLIRAHDLGERNIELFRYYAMHGPDRTVFRFSRKTGKLETLGMVRELSKAGWSHLSS